MGRTPLAHRDIQDDGSPFWVEAGGDGVCPVCASTGTKDRLADHVLREARRLLAGDAGRALAYLRCGVCGTVYAPDGVPPRYEREEGSDDALRFYLEEGAGIDLMLEPLFRLDRTGVRTYAEIGCSFGFSLDVARLCFGWNVRGVDPSPAARAGREALGLAIELRYLSESEPLGPPAVDVLQAAEVIEHVTDPHGFVRALLASLPDHGVLVISTPNAAALRADAPDSLLLQVMQPGVHLTLFTARGLVALADAAGLRHHFIHETGDDVTLYASRKPFAFHADAGCDRAIYLDYLRRRLPSAPRGGALRRGLLSRIAKELTLQGRFDEFDALIEDLFDEFRRAGIDLADPSSHATPSSPPYNLGSVLYCLGMRELIGRQDRGRAITYFNRCIEAQERAGAPLAVGGVEDASGANVARLARMQAATARIALDPVAEHDRGGVLSPYHVRLLFLELVNRADYARAAVHFDVVAASAAAFDGDAPADDDGSIGHRAMTCFTLGVFQLNHRQDRGSAREWLHRAVALAARDPAYEPVGAAAKTALTYAADP